MKQPKGKTNKSGKLHGFYKYYFDNGNVRGEFSYQNGIQNGPFRMYHENGRIRMIGQSIQHRAHGLIMAYSEDGNSETQIICII